MKKIGKAIFVFGLIFALMYSFVYFFVIPKTAETLMPYKWKPSLLNQPRINVINYLGQPDSTNGNMDFWGEYRSNYHYSLIVEYNPEDSVAEKYRVNYSINKGLFCRSQLIAIDSLH